MKLIFCANPLTVGEFYRQTLLANRRETESCSAKIGGRDKIQVDRQQSFDAPRENDGGGEQFNGREGETATLLVGLSVSLTLRGGGFAPRHLSRYAELLKPIKLTRKPEFY